MKVRSIFVTLSLISVLVPIYSFQMNNYGFLQAEINTLHGCQVSKCSCLSKQDLIANPNNVPDCAIKETEHCYTLAECRPVEDKCQFIFNKPSRKCLNEKSICKVVGNSGELCVDVNAPEKMYTDQWKPEFECYKVAKCGVRFDGKCGWYQTKVLTECFKAKKGDAVHTIQVVQPVTPSSASVSIPAPLNNLSVNENTATVSNPTPIIITPSTTTDKQDNNNTISSTPAISNTNPQILSQPENLNKSNNTEQSNSTPITPQANNTLPASTPPTPASANNITIQKTDNLVSPSVNNNTSTQV